jgi:hypothetical protein
MNKTTLACALLAGLWATTISAATQCDRACLIGHADKFLEAIIAHDPKRLPLAPNVKYTENGQVMEVGDGMWQTASEVGMYKQYVADPQGGAVGFYGSLIESGEISVLGFRMKLDGAGKISEIETVAHRYPGKAPGSGKELNEARVPAIWDETLQASERTPRQKMIEIANSYFTKIERGNGNHPTPFDPSCNRAENGRQTTNNQKMGGIFAMGCDDQISTGLFVFDTELRDRRFTVIDEEKGVILTHVFFDHAGNVKTWKHLKTGEVHPIGPGMLRPHSYQIIELFKIKTGRIYQIAAVVTDVPYKMRSNWEK